MGYVRGGDDEISTVVMVDALHFILALLDAKSPQSHGEVDGGGAGRVPITLPRR